MIRPEGLVKQARDYKMPAVAVTDHGNMFGAVDFYQKAMSAGVKPIIGCEVYVAPGSRHDKEPPQRGGPRYTSNHLILLVKNDIGYKNLCKLLTQAYTEGFYYKPRVDKDLLAEYNEGLIALSACLKGEVASKICMGQMDEASEAAGFYKETFDKRFFLEIQQNGIEAQNKANEGLVSLSKSMGLPLVATNDCHYLTKEEAKYHDLLLCIQTGKTVNSENRMKFSTEELYFKSPEVMTELFRDYPEAIRNTVEIAERCNLEMKLGEDHLPDFPTPEGKTLDSFLEERAKDGLEKRLSVMATHGMDVEKEKWQYIERLDKEIKVIERMGFPGYFLIVTDFIDYAREKDIPVGPGRGSAAGSLVAYALGITNLDPIKNNLLFERFLNPDRISLPDIDIDFCIQGRDEVIKYVTEKYGQENVTQIITFGQMRARAVIRDVGRALDMSYADVDRIAKLVPNQLNITIEEALKQEPELPKLMKSDSRVDELITAAKFLEGLPRHASTHAAGVVISNKPIVEYLPLYMGQKDNVVTTQFAMKDVESIGLVKFDFLGLKTLTVIDRAVRLIKENREVEIDIENLSVDDGATYKLLSKANTNGVFQLESSGIKDLLRKLKPSDFEDLMAAVALYRPGPLKSGMVDDFIKRKHKKTALKYETPELKDILDNTYGVIVYQEQVMEIVRVLAGFTPGEADHLRKVMGKKLTDEMLKLRVKFLEGAKVKNIKKKTAETIYDLIAHFAGYGFNKSHSAAYALIAYQTAYLKAHYPVEFLAALLTADMGDTDKIIRYMTECRDMGIEVLPPDLNRSSMDFAVEGKSIFFGLGAIKNVGNSAIAEILSVREDGPFTTLLDFLSRADTRKINKKVAESLVKCGAFDFTGQKRSELFASLEQQMDTAQSVQRDRNDGQESIFDVLGTQESPKVELKVDYVEWTDKERLVFEKETLGLYLSSHPLEGHTADLERVTTDNTEELKERRSNEIVTVGGVVSECKIINTRKGDRMAFVRVEDLHGSVEAVVFSDLFNKSKELTQIDSLVVLSGRVDRGDEAVKIIADKITALDDAEEVVVKKVHIITRREVLDKTRLEALKKTLERWPGQSPVFLHILGADDKDVVISLPSTLNVNPRDETFESVRKIIQGSEIRVR
jgi:DNA polymerase-3 subunit alpha